MSDDELLREAEVLAARYAEHYDAEHAEAMKELVRLCMRRLRGTSRLVAEARKREHIKLENIKEFERQRLAARQKLADELEVVRRAVALAMARRS
jgi:hypothetical protein